MISQYNFMKFYDFDHFSTKFDLDTTGRASDWRLARSTRTPGLLTHAESTKTHIHSTTENAMKIRMLPTVVSILVHPTSEGMESRQAPAQAVTIDQLWYSRNCASKTVQPKKGRWYVHVEPAVSPYWLHLSAENCTAKERAVVRAPGANTGG